MIDTAYIPLAAELMQRLSPEQAWYYRIIPKSASALSLAFYIDNQHHTLNLQDELEVVFGSAIDLEPIDSETIEKTLSKYYLKKEAAASRSRHLEVSGEDFLFRLIKESKDMGSSDIHIETYEERSRIRIRIDGLLIERYILQKSDYPVLVNKIKILANLDIAEKRLPQDGRIFFSQDNSGKSYKFDIRVSVVPTLYGEKIVMRILSNDSTNINIYHLGFSEVDLENYLEGIRRPTGMLLISGPTGSGKTTSLYATLKLLNKESRNILTIEDPIEYTLEGINQVQLKESIGLNFASTLRTFLRQDPDVIMVGEIRDVETANMAVRASLTGHLVLSTIHTNSAWGTVSRLIDMGVAPFLLAGTLNTTVAQRLLRLLCPFCKKEATFEEKLYPKNFKPFRSLKTHCTAVGCTACHFTGYKGRKAVYEVIPIDRELSERIKQAQLDISEWFASRNIKTLAENAFELFEKGDTTLEEIYPLLFGA